MKAVTRAVLDMVGGSVASALGFSLAALGCELLRRTGIGLPLFGDKGGLLWPLFVGLPVGGAAGLWVVERVIYRARPRIVRALVVGFIPAVVSMCLAVLLVDRIGPVAFLAFPPLVAACLTVTLRIVSRASRSSSPYASGVG